MIKRFRVFIAVASAIGYAFAFQARAQSSDPGDPRVMWVAQALTRMLTIKPGMTRDDLLMVFTTEGGISSRQQQTFVSRECPYFKVDVEFKPASEWGADTISRISRPYLEFAIAD